MLAIALSGGESVGEERGVELLHHIKAEFDGAGRPAFTTKTLITALCADEEKPWATYNRGQRITDRQLARLLKPFGIISETVQTSATREASQAKGYRRAHFDDAFDRYLTSANDASRQTGGSQASKRTDADETGTTRDFCERPETDLDGREKCEKSASDGGLYAWTYKNPETPREGSSDHRQGGNGTVHSDDEAEPDGNHLTIPQWLDRRSEVCDRCGQPGGRECAYDGTTVRLHSGCERPWILAYEASRNDPMDGMGARS